MYVSPLKALSADIHKNLAEPRAGIHRLAAEAGLHAPRITAAVRTGDTTQTERVSDATDAASHPRDDAGIAVPAAHVGPQPPDVAHRAHRDRGRDPRRHRLPPGRAPGADARAARSRCRASASAHRPVGDSDADRGGRAAFSPPATRLAAPSSMSVTGVAMDLGVEMPRSTLDAVMSHEVWEEYYDRLAALVAAHRTTLIFVNTRRMAERLARHLSDRLGDDVVTAHHGSLSKDKRLDAETRLKSGQLKALVATASLELGIDIGHVDLVCQIGSPHRIATLLQRVGRSGHTIAGTPKGRVFPVSRDDLVECAALLRSIRSGLLDAIVSHDAPLDVLAQQIVAESACREYLGGRSLCARDARVAVSAPRTRDLRQRAAHDGRRLCHPPRPPRRPGAPRRGQRDGPGTPWREAPRPDVRRRHPGGRRLSRRPRSGRHVHRHAQRGFRDREHRRRRLSARQRVVAHPAGRRRQRPGRRREGSASDDPVLAGRGAGTQRRALARGERPSGRGRSTAGRSRGPRAHHRVDDGGNRPRQGCRRRGGVVPRGRPSRARRHSVAGHARARTVLRRVRRHAARAARAVRQPHQQGLGAGPAQALLPPVQLRTAGGRDRRRADALARPAALVPAVGCLPVSAPGDDARRARAGISRRARVQDAVAVEHDDLAGRAARERRAQGGTADPADAGGRPDGGSVSRRGRLPREHPRRSTDPRPSARLSDRARLPRGGDGLRRASRRAGANPSRRAAAGRARHAGAVALRARDPQRQAVRVPGRRAARGASQPRGAIQAGHGSRFDRQMSVRSTRTRLRACARRSVRIRATPTNCTTRC